MKNFLLASALLILVSCGGQRDGRDTMSSMAAVPESPRQVSGRAVSQTVAPAAAEAPKPVDVQQPINEPASGSKSMAEVIEGPALGTYDVYAWDGGTGKVYLFSFDLLPSRTYSVMGVEGEYAWNDATHTVRWLSGLFEELARQDPNKIYAEAELTDTRLVVGSGLSGYFRSVSEPTQVSATTIPSAGYSYLDLLGRRFDDPVILTVTDSYCSLQTITWSKWLCEPLGLDFYMAERSIVTGVIMYPPGHADYVGYGLDLPFELTWNDTRADVERKLGVPDSDDQTFGASYKFSGGELIIYYPPDTYGNPSSLILKVWVNISQ